MGKEYNRNRSEGVDGNLSERFLADLRGLIWKEISSDGSFKDLASKADLNEATIARLMWHSDRYPQTKRPHFETVVRILTALKKADLLRQAFLGGADTESIPYGRKRA